MTLTETFITEVLGLTSEVLDLERSILKRSGDSVRGDFIDLDCACVSITRFATCWLENEDLRARSEWETLFNARLQDQLVMVAAHLNSRKSGGCFSPEELVLMGEVGAHLWQQALSLTLVPSILDKFPRYLMNGARIS